MKSQQKNNHQSFFSPKTDIQQEEEKGSGLVNSFTVKQINKEPVEVDDMPQKEEK